MSEFFTLFFYIVKIPLAGKILIENRVALLSPLEMAKTWSDESIVNKIYFSYESF